MEIVLLVLFVVSMFLWMLTVLPVQATQNWASYSGLLAWFAVLFLALMWIIGGGVPVHR